MVLIRITLAILLVACALGCAKSTSLTFYVTNINGSEQAVRLQVYVNDSLCINDLFKYSSVTPNYDLYKLKVDEGAHILKVLKDDKKILSDTFTLHDNLFIYLSYGKGSHGEGVIFLKKTTTDYKLH